MIGILYTILNTICKEAACIHEINKNNECRERDKDNGKLWYIAYDGRLRSKTNNHLLSNNFILRNGDVVLLDLETNQVLYNYSKSKLIEEDKTFIHKNNIQNDGTTVCISNGNNQIRGKQYKDIVTGDIYVIRKLSDCSYYYVNIHTLEFVRPTDYQNKIDLIHKNSDPDYYMFCIKKRSEEINKKRQSIYYETSIKNNCVSEMEERK